MIGKLLERASLFVNSFRAEHDERAQVIVDDEEAFAMDAVQGDYGNEIDVTPLKAMALPAVYCAIRILAEGTSQMPIDVMQKVEGSGARVANEMRLQWILKNRPNDLMPSTVWRRQQQASLAGWGNAYSLIRRNLKQEIHSLAPLHPGKVRPVTRNGQLHYEYERESYGPREILHLRGPITLDGIRGVDPITASCASFELGLQAQRYGVNYYRNDATPGLVLKTKANPDKKKRREIRRAWRENYSGTHRAGSVAILQNGLDIEPIGVSPDAARLIETMRFTVPEVARLYNIPPSKLMDFEFSADRANVEESNLSYLIHSLGPWINLWEEQLEFSLLTEEQVRAGYFIRINPMGLLRSDAKARKEFYQASRQWGWMSVDEIRSLEDMNPLPHGLGQRYLEPLNMAVLDARTGERIDPSANGEAPASDPEPGDANIGDEGDAGEPLDLDELDNGERGESQALNGRGIISKMEEVFGVAA